MKRCIRKAQVKRVRLDEIQTTNILLAAGFGPLRSIAPLISIATISRPGGKRLTPMATTSDNRILSNREVPIYLQICLDQCNCVVHSSYLNL